MRSAAASLAPQHRSTQRTARCRSNKRDFQPNSMINMSSMCAQTTLHQRRAAEYRCNTWKSTCCILSGAPAPPDPTYSTVQEQQTGFSSRYDDTQVFYVRMHNSLHKKSSRISLQLDRYPSCSGFHPPFISAPQHKTNKQIWHV